MATLTLTIGSLAASRNFVDANAQRVLLGAFALFHQGKECEPITYTAQEKLDYIVEELIPLLLRDRAQQYEELQAVADAQAEVRADPPILE